MDDKNTTIVVLITNTTKRSVIKQVITVKERHVRYDYIYNRPTSTLDKIIYKLDSLIIFIKSLFDKNDNNNHDVIKDLYAEEEAYNESIFPTIRKDK